MEIFMMDVGYSSSSDESDDLEPLRKMCFSICKSSFAVFESMISLIIDGMRASGSLKTSMASFFYLSVSESTTLSVSEDDETLLSFSTDTPPFRKDFPVPLVTRLLIWLTFFFLKFLVLFLLICCEYYP